MNTKGWEQHFMKTGVGATLYEDRGVGATLYGN